MDRLSVTLVKTIYGLVQASRAYFLLMVSTLKNFKFEQSLADPCLFTRINNDGTAHCGVYVDDIYIVGDDKAVHQTIADIKSRFNLVILDEMWWKNISNEIENELRVLSQILENFNRSLVIQSELDELKFCTQSFINFMLVFFF